jgi:hypothetical protein
MQRYGRSKEKAEEEREQKLKSHETVVRSDRERNLTEIK